jgi:hypothetical protein
MEFIERYADRIVYISGRKIEEYLGWEKFSGSDDVELRRFLGREKQGAEVTRPQGEDGEADT